MDHFIPGRFFPLKKRNIFHRETKMKKGEDCLIPGRIMAQFCRMINVTTRLLNHLLMKLIVLSGRILFSLIFLNTINFHFTRAAIDYATSYNVPYPEFTVPAAGVLAIIGALSIILGVKAKWGAWCIVWFLVPVTFYLHPFWKETEQMMIQAQTANFFKNVSMLGGALIIAYFGSGPLSMDVLAQRRQQKQKAEREVKQKAEEKKEVMV